MRWENLQPYKHLALTCISLLGAELVLIHAWHENVKSEFSHEIKKISPLLIIFKTESSFALFYVVPMCRLVAPKCYICTLFICCCSNPVKHHLCRWFWLNAREIHYIKLMVIMGVCICHIISLTSQRGFHERRAVYRNPSCSDKTTCTPPSLTSKSEIRLTTLLTACRVS